MNKFLGNCWYYPIKDKQLFADGWTEVYHSLAAPEFFTGDNMIILGRNLSFVDDAKFMELVGRHMPNDPQYSIAWRMHVLCWAGRNGLRRDGAFVECGTYEGLTGIMMCEYLGLAETDRKFYMYDLFEHREDMPHHSMPKHGAELHGQVQERFAAFPNVRVIKGEVPGILHAEAPERVAFLHIDMNNPDAEIGALEILFDRIAPGGCVVLDDYGWLPYAAQKRAADSFFAARGYVVAELPTGQGLVIK